jgi:hypothetical protein
MTIPAKERRDWPEWAWYAGIIGLVAIVWQLEERWDGAGLVLLLVILVALRIAFRKPAKTS